MDLHFTDTDGSLLGSIVGAIVAIATAIGWWYHVRKLRRADGVDENVSKSLNFVLTELRNELGRLSAENVELRGRVSACESRWAALQQAVTK